MSSTSIGPGENSGGNEPEQSDGCGNKTFGEQGKQVPPTGNDRVKQAEEAFPDGPNVGPSPWEKDAAQGKLPRA